MHVFNGHQHLPYMLHGEWELNKSDSMVLLMYDFLVVLFKATHPRKEICTDQKSAFLICY